VATVKIITNISPPPAQVIHRFSTNQKLSTGYAQVVDILGITCVYPVDNSRVVDKVMHRLSTGCAQGQPKLSTGLSTWP